MKIRTNIKSGAIDNGVSGNNHNEKMMNNNKGSFENGKRFIKKLRLNKETIRELKQSELRRIGGGDITDTVDCNTRVGCFSRVNCTLFPC